LCVIFLFFKLKSPSNSYKLVGLGTYDHNLSELVRSVERWSQSVMNVIGGHRWSHVIKSGRNRLGFV